MSDEAKMQAVSQLANKLVAESPEFNKVVAGMLASRQLYAMCLYELERLCDQTEFSKLLETEVELDKSSIVLFREILINAAAVQAQQPFEGVALLQNLQSSTIPWLNVIVDKHTELQNQVRQNYFKEREQIRRDLKLDLELPVDQEGTELDRKESIVLVGHKPVLQFVLRELLASVKQEKANVGQLVCLKQDTQVEDDAQIYGVDLSAWKGINDTNSGFSKFYIEHIIPKLSLPADVLLIEDLTAAVTLSEQLPFQQRANEAQKRFKRWGLEAGCLTIGLVPLPTTAKIDCSSPEYSNLMLHNKLRHVFVEEKDGQYDVYVGRRVFKSNVDPSLFQ